MYVCKMNKYAYDCEVSLNGIMFSFLMFMENYCIIRNHLTVVCKISDVNEALFFIQYHFLFMWMP